MSSINSYSCPDCNGSLHFQIPESECIKCPFALGTCRHCGDFSMNCEDHNLIICNHCAETFITNIKKDNNNNRYFLGVNGKGRLKLVPLNKIKEMFKNDSTKNFV